MLRLLLWLSVLTLLGQESLAQFVQTQPPRENALGRPELLSYGTFDPYTEIYHPTDLLVRISPDGNQFVSLTDVGALIVYEQGKGPVTRAICWLETKQSHNPFAPVQKATPLCAAFSPDNRYMTAGSQEGVAFIWDMRVSVDWENPIEAARALPCSYTLRGHTGPIRQIHFSPDGTMIATGSSDATVRLWQRADGQLSRTIQTDSAINDLCYSADGTQLIVGTQQGAIQVYSTQTGRLQRTLSGHQGGVRSVACQASGQILSGGNDKLIRTWSLATGMLQQTIVWHSGPIEQVAYLGDKPFFVTLGAEQPAVLYLWELGDGEPVQQLPQGGIPYLSNVTSSGAFISLIRPINRYTLYKLNR